MLPDRTIVKWCSECDLFLAGHPAEGINTKLDVPRKDALVDSVCIIAEATTNDRSDEVNGGTFALLRLAGLIWGRRLLSQVLALTCVRVADEVINLVNPHRDTGGVFLNCSIQCNEIRFNINQ